MQKIICLMEEINGETEKYINSFDDEETEIYIYDSVIESCEEKKFYLAGELFSIFCENDSKCSIVTDIKEVYEIASSIYYPLFENIDYMEQNVNNRFKDDLDYIELLKFESKFFNDGTENENIELILKSLKVEQLYGYSKLVNELEFDSITKKAKSMEFYIHICRTILFAEKKGSLYVNRYMKIYLYSMLMKIEKRCENTNDFLRYYIDNIEDEESDYFIWNQIKRGCLIHEINIDTEGKRLHDFIYKRCFETCKNEFVEVSNKIPYEERNKDVVLVMSIQFLSERHAPTKTIMERCKSLKGIGKKVVLINTTEQYNVYGCIPFFHIFSGNVIEEYNKISEIDMKGEKIEFYQMKELQSINEKYNTIRKIIDKIKPEYILSIGTGSMLADLSSYIIPCAEMALTFSSLPHTENCIPILGRRLTQNDRRKDIIESRFTFELNEQKQTMSRIKMNIPQDRFILLIIGIRLDYEITNSFLKMLSECCAKGCYIVFAGVYDKYQEDMQRYSNLRENSKFIGYCKDMLALCEICDLYVNPERIGGGFSVIEAFSKKIPGVYLKYGDVYTAGGSDFAVESLTDMYNEIMRYKSNTYFYDQQAQKAKVRAEYMTSSLEAMRELDREIMKRIK